MDGIFLPILLLRFLPSQEWSTGGRNIFDDFALEIPAYAGMVLWGVMVWLAYLAGEIVEGRRNCRRIWHCCGCHTPVGDGGCRFAARRFLLSQEWSTWGRRFVGDFGDGADNNLAGCRFAAFLPTQEWFVPPPAPPLRQ